MRLVNATWFPLTIVVGLAVLTSWVKYNLPTLDEQTQAEKRHDPDYIIENFQSVRLDAQGKQKYLLNAKELRHYPDDNSTHLVMPHFSSFSPDETVSIQSKNGRISENGKYYEFLNDVYLIRQNIHEHQDFLSLETNQLKVYPDQQFVKSETDVKIRQGESVVTAVGLDFDQNKRIVKLHSRVKGTYVKAQ